MPQNIIGDKNLYRLLELGDIKKTWGKGLVSDY
jgi:hypothetical protein